MFEYLPMTRERWVEMIWTCLASIALACLVTAGLAFLMVVTTPAQAQHVHPDETITDERVAKFYETWAMPPQRITSCCDKKDCYSAQIRRRHGAWEYLHKWSGEWKPLPEDRIESNLADPRETPDGGNHVCANEYTGFVYCAVLGAGG